MNEEKLHVLSKPEKKRLKLMDYKKEIDYINSL